MPPLIRPNPPQSISPKLYPIPQWWLIRGSNLLRLVLIAASSARDVPGDGPAQRLAQIGGTHEAKGASRRGRLRLDLPGAGAAPRPPGDGGAFESGDGDPFLHAASDRRGIRHAKFDLHLHAHPVDSIHHADWDTAHHDIVGYSD
jgi:hypothetical protein